MVDPDMQCLVMDIGHGRMKCGFSGDDAPRTRFPTILGRPLYGVLDGRDIFVGYEARRKRDKLKIKNPIPVCRDEDYNFRTLELIFHHAFYNELSVTPDEHPVMITSLPDRMSKDTFTRLTEMFLEYIGFNVPAIHICDPHVLSLIASGRVSGQVLECGSGTTSTISIFEGLPIQHTKMVLEDRANRKQKKIAGDLLTDILLQKLTQNNSKLEPDKIHPHRDHEMARKIKELYMSFTIDEDLARTVPKRVRIQEFDVKEPKEPNYNIHSYYLDDDDYFNIIEERRLRRKDYEARMRKYNNRIQRNINTERGSIIKYSLPDGSKVIDIGDERFDVPELLFRPRVIPGYNLPGIHQLVKSSILKNSDDEMVETMYKNVVVAGGSTMIGNFQPKMYLEMKDIIPQESRYRNVLKVSAPPDRKDSVWKGGSILTSLATFEEQWVTKDEYEEYGTGIVEAKCPMATTENLRQEPFQVFFVDQDMEERRIYVLEECFVGMKKNDEGELEHEFRISTGSCDFGIRFKSLLLL